MAEKSVALGAGVPSTLASTDIGGGDRWAGCCQAGRPPRDVAKWASVIQHALIHFNEGWANGHAWNVRYVEFINEPFGLGGFRADQPNQACEAYAALANAVGAYHAQ
jgi:hypothetical protein